MKKHRWPVLCLIIGISLSLFGCGRNPGTPEVLRFDFSDYENCTITAFQEGKLICLRDFSRFFEIDPKTEAETEYAGAISNYSIGGNGYAVTPGKYYACVMDLDETVTLYEVDCQRRSVSPLADYHDVSPMVYLWATPDGILQLKTPRRETNRRTYFDLYHLDTGETELVIQAPGDDLFCHASIYENTLYVLTSHGTKSDSPWVLQSYDLKTYQLLGEISLDAISDYLGQARIAEMEVLGDYLYFANWSDQGLIAKMTADAVTPVVEQDSLLSAKCYDRSGQTKERLFYMQPTDECLLLQLDTGETRTFRVNRQEGFELWTVAIDGNRLFLMETKVPESKLEKEKTVLHFYDYDDFISQNIPASD